MFGCPGHYRPRITKSQHCDFSVAVRGVHKVSDVHRVSGIRSLRTEVVRIAEVVARAGGEQKSRAAEGR